MRKLPILLFSLLFAATGATAQDSAKGRWFEVEVILFTRTPHGEDVKEEFPPVVEPIRFRRTRDLLTPYFFPDISSLVLTPDFICPLDKVFRTDPNLFRFELPETEASESLEPQPNDLSGELVAQSPASMGDGQTAETPQPDTLVQQQQLSPATDDLTNSGAIETVEDQAMEASNDTQPMPGDAEIERAINTPFTPADLSPASGRFAGFVTDRPDCLSSIWPEVAGVDNGDLSYHYDMFPRVVDAGEMQDDPHVHLMNPASFKMRRIYRTLRRQPDIRPILHVGWRQPGVGPKYSRATRLYAGIDFSRRFDFQGNPKPQENLQPLPPVEPERVETSPPQNQSVVDNIERVLSLVDHGAKVNFKDNTIEPLPNQDTGQDPDEVRELDGLFRIYIDQFNYLHINAEFNVRREVPAPLAAVPNNIDALLDEQSVSQTQSVLPSDQAPTVLKTYHFKQTRRVITKQIHYFDHPYMGMIVQIRRYGW